MRISVVGYYMNDSCLTQSKRHQGFDSDAFCHRCCFCYSRWNTAQSFGWKEKKED
jgi:hypothetical protein